jgi:hypothetical protein
MGISRDLAVQNLTSVVRDDEKAVQNARPERRDGEEVHRRDGLAMVSEERQPLLPRMWISGGSSDPSRNTPFRDIETQLEQFAVSAWRTPGRILGNHTKEAWAHWPPPDFPNYAAGSEGPTSGHELIEIRGNTTEQRYRMRVASAHR